MTRVIEPLPTDPNFTVVTGVDLIEKINEIIEVVNHLQEEFVEHAHYLPPNSAVTERPSRLAR